MHYAATQNNLGVAYRALAEEEDKSENCLNAINSYQSALKIYTYKNFPIQYGSTQNNIGLAHRTLAEIQDRLPNSKKAIEAFENALGVFTEEEFPETFELIRTNLEEVKKIAKA